jgi:hypothetical protein
MRDIFNTSGNQVVHSHNLMPFADQQIAQMATEKSRSARNQYAHGSTLLLLETKSFTLDKRQ